MLDKFHLILVILDFYNLIMSCMYLILRKPYSTFQIYWLIILSFLNFLIVSTLLRLGAYEPFYLNALLNVACTKAKVYVLQFTQYFSIKFPQINLSHYLLLVLFFIPIKLIVSILQNLEISHVCLLLQRN